MYLVKSSTDIDRGSLDDSVDNIGKWRQEIRGVYFRVEEDLRGKEAFIANVDAIFLQNTQGEILT